MGTATTTATTTATAKSMTADGAEKETKTKHQEHIIKSRLSVSSTSSFRLSSQNGDKKKEATKNTYSAAISSMTTSLLHDLGNGGGATATTSTVTAMAAMPFRGGDDQRSLLKGVEEKGRTAMNPLTFASDGDADGEADGDDDDPINGKTTITINSTTCASDDAENENENATSTSTSHGIATTINPITFASDTDTDTDNHTDINGSMNDNDNRNDSAEVLSIQESFAQKDNNSDDTTFDWKSQEDVHIADDDDVTLSFVAPTKTPIHSIAMSFSQKESAPSSSTTTTTPLPHKTNDLPKEIGASMDSASTITQGVSTRRSGQRYHSDDALHEGGNDDTKEMAWYNKNDGSAATKKTSFVGVRVYTKFPANGQYYWGLIVREHPRENLHDTAYYAVWFDDGDFAEKISGKKITTEDEYRIKWQECLGKTIPRRPRHLCEYKVDDDGNIVIEDHSVITAAVSVKQDSDSDDTDDDDDYDASCVWSPQKLFASRCDKCCLCIRPNCENCASCRYNNNGCRSVSKHTAAPHVCFRKMCLEIHEDKKAQPAAGFPQGWSFFFSTVGASTNKPSSLAVAELYIRSPAGVKFRSVEAARGRHKVQLAGLANLKHHFLEHIGEVGSLSPLATPDGKITNNSKRMQHVDKSVGKKRRKGERVLSAIKNIGSRVYCKFTNGAYYYGEIVDKFRKEGDSGYHYAVQFDDGDTLCDVYDNSGHEANIDLFNVYTEMECKKMSGKYPPPRPAHLMPDKPHKKFYTPAELYRQRCRKCRLCNKMDCRLCTSCRSNAAGRGEKECCLQNMCQTIIKDMKKQPAPGLPGGWTFFSGEGEQIVIVSPDNDEFDTIGDALDHCGCDLDYCTESMAKFQSHIGGSVLWSDTTNDLVGKQYRHEWCDLDGRTTVIYGEITECKRDRLDRNFHLFTVTYNDQAREEVDAKKIFHSLKVPRTQEFSLDWALGGCNTYRERILKKEPLLLEGRKGIRWLIPEMRTENLVSRSDGGELLPQLKMTWNGFRIIFEVLASTIPNAGHGVFVRCISLIPGRTELRLNSLELLDMGVYAPFRKEDIKEQSIFLMKNFIYNNEPEGWAFESGDKDYQYDITDDFTGELHSHASRHILPYVNECKPGGKQTVHAEHDPLGAVHYLLGSKSHNLVLPTDDSRSEIFINYGSTYEKVRIRKKYSVLSSSEQREFVVTSSKEAYEIFQEICQFTEQETTKLINFLKLVFTTGRMYSPDSIRRALAVAVLLRRRALLLGGKMDESPFAVEFAEDISLCHELVATLLAMQNNARLTGFNMSKDFDSLIIEVVTPFLIQFRPSKLAKALSSMTSDYNITGKNDCAMIRGGSHEQAEN